MNFHKSGVSSSSPSKLKQHSSLKNPHKSQPASAGAAMVLHNLSPASEDSPKNQHEHCTETLKHFKFWIIIIAERLQALFATWILVKPTYLWLHCNKAHVLSTDIPKSKYIAEHNIQPWLTSQGTEHSTEPEPLAVSETDCSWNPVGSEGATELTGLATSCRLLISQAISKYCGRGQLQPTGILRFCIVLEAQCDTLLKNYFLTILVWKKK